MTNRTVASAQKQSHFHGQRVAPMRQVRSILNAPLQPKLKVGAANDPSEVEADRVADQVMRMPQPKGQAVAFPASVSTILRGGSHIQRLCDKCEDERHPNPAEENVHRKKDQKEEFARTKEERGAAPALTASSTGAIRSLRGGGAPLPASERAFFEPRFGRSFENVRLHDGPNAAAAAKRINARAFAFGNDIAFARDERRPGTQAGRRLLAHELTHTVQQCGRETAVQREEGDDWVQDRDGNLYYPTRPEAERRQGALESQGEWEEFRITSFERSGEIFWRVEMRRRRSAEAPPPEEAPPPDQAPPEPAPPAEGAEPEPRDDWVQDRDGNLYYPTRPEAERRQGALESQGEWEEFRITSFERSGETFWRVEMRRHRSGEAPSEGGEQTASGDEAEHTPTQTICLTFDDGPQPGTENILNVLQANSAPGVFFMTGRNMRSDAATQLALMQRMLTEGHQIGNHTFTHVPARGSDYRSTYGDLSTDAARTSFAANYQSNRQHFDSLFQAAGATFPSFTLARLPGQGRFIRFNDVLVYVRETERLGMVHVGWDFEFAPNGAFGHVNEDDWKGITGVAAELDRYPRNSEIILFHDRHWNGTNGTLFTNLIARLIARGFRFGRINSSGNCQ